MTKLQYIDFGPVGALKCAMITAKICIDDLSGFSQNICRVKPILPDGQGAKLVAEGSFSEVWELGGICCRFTSSRKHGDKFVSRLAHVMETVIMHDLSCEIYAYGYLYEQKSREEVTGILFFMERLTPLLCKDAEEAEDRIWESVQNISQYGFHNDLKADNIMCSPKEGRPRVIDFDFFDPFKILVSVTAFQNIELDLGDFFAKFDDESVVHLFRAFYDYSYLSASISGSHPLYFHVLNRLHTVYQKLHDPVLLELFEFLGPKRCTDIPMEILVRCPEVDGVSINLLDLAGNSYAHRQPDWQRFPSLVRSNGVYWPGR